MMLIAGVVCHWAAPLLARAATLGLWVPGLVVVTLASAATGAVLPLICHLLPTDGKPGRTVGIVFGANIFGAVAGPLVTGYLLLDFAPLSTVSAILLGCVLLVVGCLALLGAMDPLRSRGVQVILGLAVLSAVSTPWIYEGLYERLLYKGRFSSDTGFVQTVENRHGVVHVTKTGEVYGGGAYDGALNVDLESRINGIERAYALLGIRDRPREALMIGLGSGSWAQVVAAFPGLQSLHVIEINPGYIEVIQDSPEVATLLDNDKVRVEIDDGRRWLMRHPGSKFDMIVMNTTWNWRAYATNLLSVEFLREVRSHLKPGGVAIYNTTNSLEAIRTGISEFPYALGIGTMIAVSDSPIDLDVDLMERTWGQMEIDGRSVMTPGVRSMLLEFRAGREPWRVLQIRERKELERMSEGAAIITDDNMVTEWPFPPILSGAW
ncbi:MAG: methyltransferase domain-containing protein [Myxococcales bacterium]|nr:methyltransferase domain-containing protein [Myxococcales bacterium]